MFIRKLNPFIILLIAIIVMLKVGGQSSQNDLSGLFDVRGEAYFIFENNNPKLLPQLSKVLSIDNVTNTEVYAYANKTEFSDFLEFGIDYKLLTPPSMLHQPKMKSSVDLKSMLDWDFYPTYEAYVDMMYQFEIDYPNICEVVSIGQSIEEREILFVRISDNVGDEEGEAQFMYTGTMHGDETAGYVLLLRLIDYMLSNYGTDPRITGMVNGLDIWINPAANPDGTYAGGNSSVYGATRYNANGVDLNRNYPDPEDGPHPDGNPWQVETIAFMDFAENNHFVVSANTHGGTEVCNYPWDTWPDLHADDDWWQYVCHEYADTAQYFSPSGYMNGYDDGITNGYAWYSIAGGRQDYMNYFHQCREFTLEISNVKLLPASQLEDHWEYNYRSFLNYIEQTMFGVQGIVTDAYSGDPLYAEVIIEDHDLDSSWIYTNETTGNYFRPIYEGTYNVTFHSDGFYSQTIENVIVENRELTILDVALDSGDLIADFSASETSIPIGSSIDFTDLTYGNPVSWEWTFEGAIPSSSVLENPTGITYSEIGTFDVSLTVSDGTNTQTITKEDYIDVNVEFLIQNTTVTTCTGVFYDTGGSESDYSDDEDFTMTFLPAESNGKMEIIFTLFNVEDQSNCDYDWLKIYDGPDTNSTLIGKFCGINSPGTITATNADGALTFEFHSDGSVTEAGWEATIGCLNSIIPPVAEFTADNTSIVEGESVQFTDLTTNDPTSWEWTFEGGTPELSTEQNPLITYTTEGVYNVLLVATNEAGSNTMYKEDYITVDHITIIKDDLENALKVYPNPAKNILFIESPFEVKQVSIVDMVGENVLYTKSNQQKITLNVSELREGIYILIIETEKETYHKKVQIHQ
ncbi:MAG: PKD domain-containing protein [Bacteroidales bacterium]|nr:PKD domain-containing protein [Bacteroidales bacterium]